MQPITPCVMTTNVLPDTMQHTVLVPRFPPLVQTSNSRNRLFPLPQSLLRNIIRFSQPNK
jgi:hypothetical protein